MIRTRRLHVESLEDRLAPAAGDLDPTFGSGGVARFTTGVVLQLTPAPDGRTLALVGSPTYLAQGVMRLLPGGTPDPAFAGGGVTSLPAAGQSGVLAAAPDGGAYVGTRGSDSFTVVHVTAGGAVDPAFGSGGTATVPIPASFDSGLAAILVQPDGRVVVVGDRTGSPIIAGQPPRYYQLVLGRLTTTGQPDPSFGSNGVAVLADPSNTVTSLHAGAVALAPDGRIVVAGSASTTPLGARPQVYSPAVFRLTADGQADLTPAAGGATLLPFPDQSFGHFGVVSVLPDGRIVAAGLVRQASGAFLGGAARLTTTGQLDTSYGNGGLALTAPLATTASPYFPPAVDAAGRAVFDSASSDSFPAGTTDGVVTRLTAAGAVDTGFGVNGRVSVPALPAFAGTDPSDINLAYALAVQPNGDVLMGGTDQKGLGSVAGVVARLIGSNPPAGFVPAVHGTLTAGGPADGTSAALTPTGGTYAIAGTATVYPGFPGAVRGTTADVNADGTPDYVYTRGPGGAPQVTVIDGATGRVLADFPAFESTFTGGVFAAAADLDGDGRAEVAVTPDQGGGGRVVVFSIAPGGGVTQRASFFGIDDPAFRGGARVALGDVNHDGKPDLVVAAGFGGGPRVAIFDGNTLTTTPTRLVGDFFAFPGADAQNLRNGAYVAAGDVTGDGFADLVFGGGPGGAPRVFILSGALVAAGSIDAAYAAPVANFFVAGNSTDRGGVRVATADADGDTRADVAVGSGTGSPARVRVYAGTTFAGPAEPAALQDLAPFSGAALADGVYVG